MTLKVWQRMIVTPQCSADTPPEPRWSKADGLPCGLTGNEAESACIPAVEAMARLLNEDEP